MKNFGIKDCLNLNVYDKKGKEVIKINYLNDAEIIRSGNDMFLLLSHEISSLKLFELTYGNGDEKTDFEKELGDVEVSFGCDLNPNEYRAIGTFTIRMDEGEDKLVKLIFNSIEFYNISSVLRLSVEEVSKFNTAFKVKLDENNKFFTMKTTY